MRWIRPAISLVSLGLLALTVHAGDPSLEGAWDAPITLDLNVNDPAGNQDIAHAVLLPTGENGNVLFWARICNPYQKYYTYRWNPRVPTNITPYLVPSPGGVDGSAALKCSATVFLSNGDLLAIGGHVPNQFPSGQYEYGHRYIFRFNSLGNPPAWTLEPEQIEGDRYYSSAVVGADDEVLVAGHGGLPDATDADRYEFRTYDGTSWQWETAQLQNRVWYPWTDCNNDPIELLRMAQYPRLRYLAWSDQVMWVDGYKTDLYPNSACPHGRITAFLQMSGPIVCGETLPQRRWMVHVPPAPPPGQTYPCPEEFQILRLGHVIHFVEVDQDTGAGTDTIYQISGGVSGACGVPTFDTIRMMRNPGIGVNWQAVQSAVTTGRTLANAVVLADGTIALIGGCDSSGSGTLTPELIDPGVLADPLDDVVQPLAPSALDRRMHSVGLLLPDGSLWFAGGEGVQNHCPQPEFPEDPAWQTYELFKPTYFFKGQRPVISDVGSGWAVGGDQLELPIQVSYGGVFVCPYPHPHNPPCAEPPPLKAVRLIRNGAVTHHDDQHQRCIELPITFQSVVGGEYVVNVKLPASHAVAPAGYYLLFVEDHKGVPTPGEFIKLD